MMPVLSIVCLVLAPSLLGALIMWIFRERNTEYVKVFSTGFLSLFVLLFCVMLVSLKLDFSFDRAEKVFFLLVALLSVIGIPAWFFVKPVFLKITKNEIVFFSLSIILFLVSYLFYSPSYTNDETLEFVTTALCKRKLFAYSVFTGKPIENGFPIFYKICVMPIFTTFLCDFFEIPVRILSGVILPFITFFTNIFLVRSIGNKLSLKNKEVFMITYELSLLSATYLPIRGMTVTNGYALLREGYSGYAVAYGISVALALLLFLDKKYIKGLCSLASLVALIRIDKFYFAILTPLKSFREMNEAGKMMAIFLCSIIAAYVYSIIKKIKIRWIALIVPSVFISYVVEKTNSFMNERKKRIAFLISVSIILLFACYFEPFKAADTHFERAKEEKEVSESLKAIPEDSMIYGSEEFMAIAKTLNGNLETLYGRDDFSSYLDGLDYEESSKYLKDYKNGYLNYLGGRKLYETDYETSYIFEKAFSEGVDYIVLPKEEGYEIISKEEWQW